MSASLLGDQLEARRKELRDSLPMGASWGHWTSELSSFTS